MKVSKLFEDSNKVTYEIVPCLESFYKGLFEVQTKLNNITKKYGIRFQTIVFRGSKEECKKWVEKHHGDSYENR